MIELHFGPAMIGAVLNTLNTRLDAEAIAFMLDHGEAKVLFTDREFSPVVDKALTARRSAAAGDRRGRRALRGRRAARRDRVRGLPRRGRPELRMELPARRVGRDRAQLHLGHDRQSQGRGATTTAAPT